MRGADYLNDHVPVADDLFAQLDEEVFEEVGILVHLIDDAIQGIDEVWAYEWMTQSDDSVDLHAFTNSFINLYEIINEQSHVPDEVYEATRELLNILEPLQEPHLMMDDEGEIHDEGYE